MCLGQSVRDIFNYFGHNGSKIISDDPEPFGRRGFHDREIADYALMLNKSMICLDRILQYYNYDHSKINQYDDYLQGDGRLYDAIRQNTCVLCGSFTKPHSVACDGELVYDPRGSVIPLEDFLRTYSFEAVDRVYVIK